MEFTPTFTFKCFAVDDRRCSMKVGTDGVFLGAWTSSLPLAPHTVCDIGSGSGLLSLMLAQRWPQAEITACEIEPAAISDLEKNVRNFALPHNINVMQSDFRELKGRYELIVSNPPFYTESEHSPRQGRALARHAGTLSPLTLIDFAPEILAPAGNLCLIAPLEQESDIIAHGALNRLYLQSLTHLVTSPRRGVTRTLMNFSNSPAKIPIAKVFAVGDDEYINLTKPYYLDK